MCLNAPSKIVPSHCVGWTPMRGDWGSQAASKVAFDAL